jgi:hypothetical protein
MPVQAPVDVIKISLPMTSSVGRVMTSRACASVACVAPERMEKKRGVLVQWCVRDACWSGIAPHAGCACSEPALKAFVLHLNAQQPPSVRRVGADMGVWRVVLTLDVQEAFVIQDLDERSVFVEADAVPLIKAEFARMLDSASFERPADK